jgi:hypothetical protein
MMCAVAAFKQEIRFTHSGDGTRLAYALAGEGYPLVRAAHWLTNIELDWQTPVWRPWFDAFGSRYRFVRYDSRGCGMSDRNATEVSLDRLVADLEAVVDAAGSVDSRCSAPRRVGFRSRWPRAIPAGQSSGAPRGVRAGPLRRAPSAEQVESIRADRVGSSGLGSGQLAFLQMFTSQIFPRATPSRRGRSTSSSDVLLA